MALTANDYEIRYVDRDGIYDLYVQGRFKNFFKTFGEAVLEVERLRDLKPMDLFNETPKRKGKCR